MGGTEAGRPERVRRVDERLGIVEEVEFFAAADGGPMFGCRHLPAATDPARLGVVICSPILTDFGANYRREVMLARRLAAAGIAVQRFHPRGVGHSAGDRLDVSLESLVADARTAADRLLATTGVEALALVGTRYSALAAAEVVRPTEGVPLVLWEPVTRARRYFREGLRAHSVHQLKLGRSGIDDPDAELAARGFIDVLGIPVGRALFEPASQHELMPALGTRRRPVLLVQLQRRDGLAPEYRPAVDAWSAFGLDVATALCPTDESWWFAPDRLAPSDEVLDATAAWLLERCESATAPAPASGPRPIAVAHDGTPVEHPVLIPAPGGDLLAVVTEPVEGTEPARLAAIMLRGAGWRPSSGPRRTQTRATRALAGLGLHGVRFSYHGIAESGGIEDDIVRLDRPHVEDTRAVTDWVAGQGLRPVLVGNCFGARTALAHAATDGSVAGLVLLVPPVHDFEVARRLDRRPLSHFARRLAPGHVAAVLRDRTRRRAAGRTGRALLDLAGRRVRTSHNGRGDSPEWLSHRFLGQLATVVDRGVPLLFVYGEDDPFGRDFERARDGALGPVLDRAAGRVRVVTVPGKVHGLTSHETQEAAIAAIVAWAATELVGAIDPAPTG